MLNGLKYIIKASILIIIAIICVKLVFFVITMDVGTAVECVSEIINEYIEFIDGFVTEHGI